MLDASNHYLATNSQSVLIRQNKETNINEPNISCDIASTSYLLTVLVMESSESNLPYSGAKNRKYVLNVYRKI